MSDPVKATILVNAESIDALSMMVRLGRAETRGRGMIEKMKKLTPPPHLFVIRAEKGASVVTGKSFRLNVMLIMAFLATASVISVTIFKSTQQPHPPLAPLIPVFIAISAAWLTYCLQRRVTYTNALRALWERVVCTVQDALQYTYVEQRDAASHAKLMHALSCRVDEIRGVFRNVGEHYVKPSAAAKKFVRDVKHAQSFDKMDKLVENFDEDATNRGLYPFESMKQIHEVVRKLGYGPHAATDRAVTARNVILRLWTILRSEMLKELDRDYPEFPDTPYMQTPRGPAVQRAVAETGKL